MNETTFRVGGGGDGSGVGFLYGSFVFWLIVGRIFNVGVRFNTNTEKITTINANVDKRDISTASVVVISRVMLCYIFN